MVKKVVFSQAPHPDALRLLEQHFQVVVPANNEEAEFIAHAKDAQGVVLRTNITMTRRVIEQCPQLKIIARTGAGVDNVDVDAATERGILVCNVMGVNSVSVAEHAVGLMFAVMKRSCVMDAAVRAGKWNIRRGNTTHELADKVLGVVGLGNIGRRVAAMCKNAFNMRVIAYDPYAVATIQAEGYGNCTTVSELFEQADVITLHCPNIPETDGLASREMLAKMKPTAILINTARGNVVDETALVEYLKAGKIAGAGLDVFSTEPPPADNPLLALDNVVLSPHVAALTEEVSTKVAVEAAQAVVDFALGKSPKDVFNREALAKR